MADAVILKTTAYNANRFADSSDAKMTSKKLLTKKQRRVAALAHNPLSLKRTLNQKNETKSKVMGPGQLRCYNIFGRGHFKNNQDDGWTDDEYNDYVDQRLAKHEHNNLNL